MAQLYQQSMQQPVAQQEAGVQNEFYLKRLSDSLRRHLAVPAQRIEPDMDANQPPAMYGNPVYQVHDQQGPDTRAMADAMRTGQQLQSMQQQAQQQVPDQQQVKGQQSQQGPGPLRQLPPLRGTLRGRYKGHASDEWLAKEMQQEVDDLARTVDNFAVLREGKLCEARNAGMVAETEQLRKAQAEMQARISGLELLIPNNNGEFTALRTELQELEKDCDIWYDRYVATQDKANKLEAEVAALRGAGGTMGPYPYMPQPGPQPPPGTELSQGGSGAAGAPGEHVALTVNADGTVTGGPPGGLPVVTPEAVLAAAVFLKEKGELPPGMVTGRYPDKRSVFVRSLLVAIFLCAIAAAILLTHFLTKHFS